MFTYDGLYVLRQLWQDLAVVCGFPRVFAGQQKDDYLMGFHETQLPSLLTHASGRQHLTSLACTASIVRARQQARLMQFLNGAFANDTESYFKLVLFLTFCVRLNRVAAVPELGNQQEEEWIPDKIGHRRRRLQNALAIFLTLQWSNCVWVRPADIGDGGEQAVAEFLENDQRCASYMRDEYAKLSAQHVVTRNIQDDNNDDVPILVFMTNLIKIGTDALFGVMSDNYENDDDVTTTTTTTTTTARWEKLFPDESIPQDGRSHSLLSQVKNTTTSLFEATEIVHFWRRSRRRGVELLPTFRSEPLLCEIGQFMLRRRAHRRRTPEQATRWYITLTRMIDEHNYNEVCELARMISGASTDGDDSRILAPIIGSGVVDDEVLFEKMIALANDVAAFGKDYIQATSSSPLDYLPAATMSTTTVADRLDELIEAMPTMPPHVKHFYARMPHAVLRQLLSTTRQKEEEGDDDDFRTLMSMIKCFARHSQCMANATFEYEGAWPSKRIPITVSVADQELFMLRESEGPFKLLNGEPSSVNDRAAV